MRLNPTEADEQKALFELCEFHRHRYPQLDLMFHIPNGGKRDAREAAHFKAQGVKAGVSDIFLPVPSSGYHGLFIEMKRRDGGKLSEYQKQWIDALKKQGYQAIVCFGAEAAMEVILNYLKRSELNENSSRTP